MFDIVEFTLASDLADAGTVTVGYPSGRSKGNYSGSTGKHVLVAGGNVYNAPADFTLTFNANASDITLTNGTGRTLVAGTDCTLQLERRGERNLDRPVVPANIEKMYGGFVFAVDLGSPNVADADGVCASQAGTADTAMTINGALASDGVATFDVPRNVVAAWTTSAKLTITGTDEYGNTIVEETASAGTSHTGKKAFKTVTSVVPDTNITGATVGTGDVFGLPVFLPSAGYVIGELEDGAVASAGTAVAGVTAEATATTGDVRGTYDPNSAADGDAGFVLLAFLPDPSNKGVAQFGG